MNDWTVGVDVGGTKMLLVAESGDIRRVERRPTGAAFTPKQLEETIADVLSSLDGPTRALGIAVPGLVSAEGRVEACDLPAALVGWSAAALAAPGRTVHLVNDAEAALVEESARLPSGATVVLVMVGTGIGAALLIEGRVYRGSRGWAGEIGWMPLATGTEVHTLDQLASGAALVRRLGRAGDVILDRARAGDSVVLDAVREAGAALGLGLAALVNLLNPEWIVVGGGAFAFPGYLEAAVDAARRHSLPPLWAACRIEPIQSGELSVALGAMRLAS